MDKNFVYFFLLLFLLYCLSNKTEGFIIDLTSLRADSGFGAGNTLLDFSYTGSVGHHCAIPPESVGYMLKDNQRWEDLPPEMLESGTFNLTSQLLGCNRTNGYENTGTAPVQAEVCGQGGGDFTLSGCSEMCHPITNFSLSPNNLYQGPDDAGALSPLGEEVDEPMSKIAEGGTGGPNIRDLQADQPCSPGAILAREGVCYSVVDGQILSYSERDCVANQGYWYDPDSHTLQGSQKAVAYCGSNSSNTLLFGCIPRCNERVWPPQNDEESIALRHSGTTGWEFNVNSDPYVIHDGAGPGAYDLNPTDFHVRFECRGEYSKLTSGVAAACDYAGNDDGGHVYRVNGCFPTCPVNKECVSISNIYENVVGGGDNPEIPSGGTAAEMFSSMKDLVGERYSDSLRDEDGGQVDPSVNDAAVDNLKNSLHYVRKYKYDADHTGVEIQFQCEYDEDASSESSTCNLLGSDATIYRQRACSKTIENEKLPEWAGGTDGTGDDRSLFVVIPDGTGSGSTGPTRPWLMGDPQTSQCENVNHEDNSDSCNVLYELDGEGRGWPCMPDATGSGFCASMLTEEDGVRVLNEDAPNTDQAHPLCVGGPVGPTDDGSWYLGSGGENCDKVCGDNGAVCVSKDWGITSSELFEEALTSADIPGLSVGDLCMNGIHPYTEAHSDRRTNYGPAAHFQGDARCYYSDIAATASCDYPARAGGDGNPRRLCRCESAGDGGH
jgi:hypothetical protein